MCGHNKPRIATGFKKIILNKVIILQVILVSIKGWYNKLSSNLASGLV